MYNKDRRKLYQSARWIALRKKLFKKDPLCVMCKEKGIVKAGVDLDHIKPSSKIPIEDFFNEDNLQWLCRECHKIKTYHDFHSLMVDCDEDGNPIMEYTESGYIIPR